MAIERANGNPYSNFNFIVLFGTEEVAAFTEVSGLDSENVPVEYREGGDSTGAPRMLPGIEKYSPVQFKRGVTGSMALWNWRQEVRDGGATFPPSKTVTIILLDETQDRNKPVMTWTLTDAWPTKMTGPSLSAKGNDYAVEEIHVVHSGMQVS